jgi:hypothetical protein
LVDQGKGVVPLDDPDAPNKTRWAVLDGISYCYLSGWLFRCLYGTATPATVMAGLVPAIHVFQVKRRRGCPGQARA